GETPALEFGHGAETRQLDDGGGEIDHLYGLFDHARLRDRARPVEDERYAYRLLVDHETVVHVAVVHQALAVIADDDREHPIEAARRRERVEDRAHLAVREADLGVVAGDRLLQRVAERSRADLRPLPGWGVVRIMGIEQVHPEEERRRRAAGLEVSVAAQPFH